MKQKIKPKELTKLFLFLLIGGLFLLVVKDIYSSLSRGAKVSEELVDLYRPHLDTASIKKAAEILQNK